MIQLKSRVRVRPDNPQLYEMLNLHNNDLIGEVVGLYEPSKYAHDVRPRWCVKLDINHYNLFYEHELEEISCA
jgi:hypothetical protein